MEQYDSFKGSYDIPIEDLKRYKQLPPEEIFRWLEGILDLTRHAHAAEKPYQYKPVKPSPDNT